MRVKESHRVPTFMAHLTWHRASRRDICRREASGSMAFVQGGTSVFSNIIEPHCYCYIELNQSFWLKFYFICIVFYPLHQYKYIVMYIIFVRIYYLYIKIYYLYHHTTYIIAILHNIYGHNDMYLLS